VDLSAFYFDILKDRLYTAPAKSTRRRAAQSTLYRIADALVRAVAPLMCFTAEEVWSHLPAHADGGRREPSVHLATFRSAQKLREGIPENRAKALDKWPTLITVRDEVLKALETARNEKLIGSPLDAKVVLAAEGAMASLLQEYRSVLPTLFIVSQVELRADSIAGAVETQLPELKVRIEKAAGRKCERCWNYSERVGEDTHYPTVCERCSTALKEIEASCP